MIYFESDLNGLEAKEIPTRLFFDIATARGKGLQLIKFTLMANSDEKIIKLISRKLRDAKKKGRIELFTTTPDFSNPTTEVEYLFNKFPELKSDKISENEIAIYVKI